MKCLLIAVVLSFAVLAQPGTREGDRLPRPVEAGERARRGFAAPRQAEAVLADLDAIEGRMRKGSDDPATWMADRAHNNAVKRDRIDLISELEESAYAGERLPELLHQKLMDIRDVGSRDSLPADGFDRLRQEMAARHKGEAMGIEAEAESMLEVVHIITKGRLRIHPEDYQRLAALELKRKDADEAGLLLLEALHTDKDEAVRQKWHDWMVESLGPKSMGRRFVIRKRSFGHPIRLEGEGLDGLKIDTASWAGDVVLVDFWGTWCIPCKEAMPELERLRAKYEGRGLRIVGVLCDDRLEKAGVWLKDQGFSWPQIVDKALTPARYDQHRIAVQYAIGGFPTLWIIDRQGVLREEGDRENLEAQVVRFLDEPRPAAK